MPKQEFSFKIWAALAAILATLGGSSRAAIAVVKVTPDVSSSTTSLVAQEAIVETVLFFETENFAVRIFRRGEALFMNLFNQQTGITELRGTPAELVPDTRNWITYRNSLGEADWFAKQGLDGRSELEIVNPVDGSTVVQEIGYDTVVGVPNGETDFTGTNFAPGTGATVIAPRYADLRQHPQPDADTILTIPRSDFVDVLDRVGNPEDGFIWYQVIYNGTKG